MTHEKDFIVPPFSVLDNRQHYWMDKKKKWINLGIESEIGRDATANPVLRKELWEKYGRKPMSGTSIFDPFLCEIMYKWFCPKDGHILDPFAGGSVRGIVAHKLNYRYTGIELRREQVDANYEQARRIVPSNIPNWIVGDSDLKLDEITSQFDFIFTCPPYHDLEVYSDDKNDLSNMDYDNFLKKYESIIKKSIEKLRDNRFYAIVVGDVRDENGYYKNFIEDTVKIFQKNGMRKYNEIILLKPLGTLPLRVNRQFNGARKVGKNHENVYIFYSGDTDSIRHNFSSIDNEKYKQKSVFSKYSCLNE